ncbi:MAG: RNA polymerase sigma factor [Acidobacteria bacterium]|nr:RNA polymerase sigma factor [Acidobacteriota bacterium]
MAKRNGVGRASKLATGIPPGEERSPNLRAVAALQEIEPQLRQVLSRHSIPIEDGQDLIQDALLVLLGRLRIPHRPIERPAGFLLGILRRLCIAYWRQRRARAEDPIEGLELGYPPQQAQVENRRLLQQLLGDLNRRHRRLVILRLVAGYEAVEVADGSGVAPGSVRKSIQRACERMRARVEADDEALRLRTAGPG